MQNSKILTWDAQKHKVSRASIVHDLQLIKVHDHDVVQYGRYIAQVVRIADIVDSHPHTEQGILGRPWRSGWMRCNAVAEFGDLIDEAEDGRLIWCYEIGVCCRSSVGEVVGEQC